MVARFLFAMPPVKPSAWTDAIITSASHEALAGAFDKLRALPMGRDADGQACPIEVPLSVGAKKLFVTFHDEIQHQQVEAGNGRMAATLAKLRGTAGRLALIVHQLSVACSVTGALHEVIDEASMEAGIKLAWWFAGEAERLFATMNETKLQRDDRELAELVEELGGRVAIRHLQHRRRKYRDNPELAKADLQGLVDAGWGRWDYPAPGPAGGRPREVFVLHAKETPDSEGETEGFVDVDRHL